MAIFYHLSHFFEFLTGIYFGSFPLLGFIQKDASNNLNRRLKSREQYAVNARTQVLEHFSIQINAKNGPTKTWRAASKWAMWSNTERYVRFLRKWTNYIITDIVTNEGIFIKRFFPVFFYTGCFCLTIMLFSGYEQASNDTICKSGINFFFMFYCLSSILFQIWGIFIFPFLVKGRDYLKLTVVNIIICSALFLISELLSTHLKFGLGYLLSKHNEDVFMTITLVIAMFPLCIMLIFCMILLVFWYISNIFYFLTLRSFSKDFGNNIQGLRDSPPI